jgi:hypothetical protein
MGVQKIHILTAYLPFWIMVIGALILQAGNFLKRPSYVKAALVLLFLDVFVAIFVGAMGGASMAPTEVSAQVNLKVLHMHAWSATIAIAGFIVLAWLIFKKIRNLASGNRNVLLDYIIAFVFVSVLILMAWTIQLANQIRP